jgi:hypothetical protein
VNLPCPECGGEMAVKPLKVRDGALPGFHFYCAGMKPVRHTVTIFWKRPQDAPAIRGSEEINGERDSVRASAPPATKVSSRVSSLLARAEKLTQRRVGNNAEK